MRGTKLNTLNRPTTQNGDTLTAAPSRRGVQTRQNGCENLFRNIQRGGVPVDVFRDRFELLRDRDGLSLREVAAWLGHTKPDGEPHTTRLSTILYRQRTVSYDVAVTLCDALGLDYFEAGV